MFDNKKRSKKSVSKNTDRSNNKNDERLKKEDSKERTL
jgi:hypothetical protein